MKLIILFLVLLFIFLIISLGINYSNVFKTTLQTAQIYKPTPISKSKYTSPTNYYADVNASQGVFSNTVSLTNYTVEPMVNKLKTPPKELLSGYKGSQGAPVKLPPKTMSSTEPSDAWMAKNGVDYAGNDLGYFDKSLDDCKSECLSTSGCVGIVTGKEEDNQCWLKSSFQTESMNADRNTYMLSNVSVDTSPTSYNDNIKAKKFKGNYMQGFGISGDNNAGYVFRGPRGNVFSNSTLPQPTTTCTESEFGCCPDNVTAKNADGSNCSTPESQYCPDGVTVKNADGSNCAPYPPPTVGGCAGTQYGCCPDNVTTKNADGSNCPLPPSPPSGWIYTGPNVTAGTFVGPNVSGIAGTGPNYSGYAIKGPNGNVYSNVTPTCNLSQYGCCPDNITAKNVDGTNCLPVVAGGCALTPYGCCPDNVTTKNADGSNCPTATGVVFNGSNVNAGVYSGPNVSAFAAQGPNNSGLIIKGPNGNVYTLSKNNTVGGCAGTQYGCCPDGVTSKSADGTNCAPYPPTVGGCAGTQYGCCPDGITSKSADGTNCAPYPPPPPGGCASSQYGCCPDNVTAKNADGSNCSPYPPPPPPPPNTNTVFIPPPSMPVQNSSSSSTEYASADGSTDNSGGTDTSTCPSCPTPQPCPPCGRCPEPSFDCKKVPNYSSTNSEYLPMPVLSDFSQFGM